MKILVTGGLGYLGSQVSYGFLQNGDDVSIIDLLSSNPYKKISGAKYAKLDIMDRNGIKKYFSHNSFDQVIHLAAKKSVIESINYPQMYRDINIQGTENLLGAASDQGCSHFILASSAAVYAESTSGFVTEDSKVLPASPYGASKLQSELILEEYTSQGKIKGCALRLFNLSGEGESDLTKSSGGSLLPTIISKLNSNESIQIFGGNYATKDGTASRDYIHILDAANSFLMASKMLTIKQIPKILNIGTGKSTTVLELVTLVESLASAKISARIESPREGEIGIMVADVRKGIEHLGPYVTHDVSSIIRSMLPI